MTNEEKLKMIETAMELDEGTLKVDDLLEKYEEWDSLSALSLIALVDNKLKKTLVEKEIRSAKTVQDLINLI